MEKVSGIGGVFFRAQDPKALGRWYEEHLGVTLTPLDYEQPPWHFRVRDLEAMVAQLQAAGVEVRVDPKKYPNGNFARLHDPEGNPIELWEPHCRDVRTSPNVR